MAALSSNEAIGTTARLGLLRLGAGRLGAVVDGPNLKPSSGLYAWTRVDSGVKRGDPPGSVEDSWTTVRRP